MPDTVKWLLVGTGDIASKRVAEALASAENSQIVSVCDLDLERAEALAARYSVSQTFVDPAEAFSHSSANAVYVATPVSSHTDYVVCALGSGRHVLVEKPLGLKWHECVPAVLAASESECKAGCAYYRRLFPRYLYAKEMLAGREFGRIISTRMVYQSWFSPSETDPKRWRVERSKSGGGVLSDMGTHMFDMLVGLFGLPESVYAVCNNLVHQWDVEDSASIVMKLSDGSHVVASFNWNSKTWRHELDIVGTEARLTMLPYDSGPVTKTVGRQVETLDLPNAENVHQPIVQDFVNAILEDRPPACPLAEAAKTNALLDVVYLSSEQKREVYLNEISSQA